MLVTPARIALRNAGLLLIQRGSLVVAAFLFAAIVPRLLGPEIYGRYALLLSLSTLFVVCSALGFTEVIGRYVPALSAKDDPRELRHLFGSLLWLRLISGGTAGVTFLAITTTWLSDLDAAAIAAVAGAVSARALAQYLFAFFLGLNRAARWGAGEVIARWLLLALVVPGFALGGFRGVCIALLLAEVGALGMGLWWSRAHFAWPGWRLDMGRVAPQLRFGLVFYVGNLLFVAVQSSGEVLVRAVVGSYAQVSYFGLANGVYFTAAAAIQQLSVAATALLVTLRSEGKDAELRETLRQMVSWLTPGVVAAFFAALLLGPATVPLVLGRSFEPVARGLIPITLALLAVTVSSTAGVVALIEDRPRTVLLGAGIRLAVFWIVGPLLVLRWESLGACLAVLAAASLQAAFVAWQVKATMARALRSWAAAAGLGGLFLPLVLLRSSWMTDCLLYAGFLVVYAMLLLGARVVSKQELFAAWRAAVPATWRRAGERTGA